MQATSSKLGLGHNNESMQDAKVSGDEWSMRTSSLSDKNMPTQVTTLSSVSDSKRLSNYRIISTLNTKEFHKPRFLLARRLFFILLCVSCGTFSFVSIGLLSVSVPEIEKQFGLLSKHSGMISAILDVSTSICTVIISIFAKNMEVLWIAGGLFIMSMGCILFAVPAIWGINFSQVGASSSLFAKSLCSLQNNNIKSFISSSSNPTASGLNANIALAIFSVAFAIIGCGIAAIPLLGPVIIKKYYPSIHRSTQLSIFYFCTITGPAIAYLIGKVFNSIPVNLKGGFVEGHFIGAWWLCFVLAAIISALLTLSLAIVYRCFSDYYPSKVQNQHEINGDEKIETKMSATWQSLKCLLKNPPYVGVTLASQMLQLLISGLAIFLPKYVEDQFGLQGSNAGLIAGASTIPGAILGTFMGGHLIKLMKLNFWGICLFSIIISVISAALIPTLLLGCQEGKLVFPGQKYSVIKEHFKPECEKMCHCDSEVTNTVCTDSGDYLLSSPCLAGCQNYTRVNNSIIYTNCLCLKDPRVNLEQGKCELRCSNFYVFIVVFLLINVGLFSLYVPIAELTMRCVQDKDIVFAMGIQQLAQRLLGQVPGPLLIGWLIDISCKFWVKVPKNQSGQFCLFYDLYIYRENIVALGLPITLVVGLSFAGALYTHREPKKIDS